MKSISYRLMQEFNDLLIPEKDLIEKLDKTRAMSIRVIIVWEKIRCEDVRCMRNKPSFIQLMETILKGEVIDLILVGFFAIQKNITIGVMNKLRQTGFGEKISMISKFPLADHIQGFIADMFVAFTVISREGLFLVEDPNGILSGDVFLEFYDLESVFLL
jgi:hypothetical protein